MKATELLGITTGLVAIDGPSGAGKSTFADELVSGLRSAGVDVALVRTDSYATWDNPVAWWPEMEREVLAPLLRGEDVRYRPLVWNDGVAEPGPRRDLDWAPLVIIEGVSAARRSVADRLDVALWVDGGSSEECLARSVARDGEAERPHLVRWQQFERGWFAVDGTKSRCRVLRPETLGAQ